jgi:hypothetical protein
VRNEWCCAALLGVLAACGNRPIVLGKAEGSLPGGAYLRVTRLAFPPGSAAYFSAFGGASDLSEGRRYYSEPGSGGYSGYEMRARDLGNRQLEVYFLKLGVPVATGTLRPLPLPRPMVLPEGEPFEIELFRGPGGRRLYDRLVFYRRR